MAKEMKIMLIGAEKVRLRMKQKLGEYNGEITH